MLRSLAVRNLALIEDLEIELGAGLNVVTGETGAGKSLLHRALAAAVGQRLGPEAVRAGAAEARIEAEFELVDAAAVSALRQELVPGAGERLRLGRAIPASGRGRAWVDGRPASAALLRELGRRLVRLQGQQESVLLVEPEVQRALLDAASGAEPAAAAYAESWARLNECLSRLDALERDASERARRLELARFDLAELERVGPPEEGELEALARERARLREVDRLTAAVSAALERLDGGEQPALGSVSRAARRIGELRELDPRLGEIGDVLEQAGAALADAVGALQGYGEGLEADPDRLQEIEDRLATLGRLARKHGCADPAELRDRRDALAREIERAERDAADPDALRRELEAAAAEAWRRAEALASLRRAGARRLAERVDAELADLGMAEARLSVEFEEVPAPLEGGLAGVLVRDGIGLGPEGFERPEFFLAANPGEGARPLARVASGGELSRLMLALRHVAGGDAVPTLVFDEVDAGIGGAAAEAVGRRLRALARRHQVLCITHLAQIAVFADRHYAVRKESSGGRTRTEVRCLEGGDRVDEIARMLAGARPGAEARRHAARMLERAGAAGAPVARGRRARAARRGS